MHAVELPSQRNAPGRPASTVERRHLLGLDLPALEHWLTSTGQPRYRAGQILRWIYERGAVSFGQMTDLSKDLRHALEEQAEILRATVSAESAADDLTRKLLLTWPDGAAIETVWIPEKTRHTACVSSQVGCPVGCKFCASGLAGVQRDLTAGEIVEQALRISRLITDRARAGELPEASRLSNIVFMGMGEPLANYAAVIAAIRILNAPWGMGIGARHITVSTVGLPKQIRQLANEGLQLNLALSLHAPYEELRRELIPWGKVPLDDLLAACREYFEKTGREITLEYVLLDGVNMGAREAAMLAKIVRALRCNVNLLRYNPVPGLPFTRPSSESAHAFQAALRERGVNSHIRTSRGKSIDAACGQLRRRALNSK